MCTNKKWIRNKFDGKKYFVPCGHCEACQMEKANKVAQKIRNNSSKNWITLFVHLTYANSCIPYIRKTDLYKGLFSTPIYRDSINRRKRLGSGYSTEKCRTFKTVQIGSFELLDIPDNIESIENLPSPTHINDTDKVGVIFLPDIQNYIKRLRSYVKYYADTYQKFDFSWFQLAEYGETFSRCHFHLLFRIPATASVKLWKSALSANWLYDDYNTTYRNIQIAVQASNYVSSYINRPSTIPPFFYQKQLAPKRSHSFRFGQAIPEFSLEEICKKIDLRNLTYDVYGIRKDGTFGAVTVSYPSYIINRYFPKFKGYFRLTPHEVEDVLNFASTIIRDAKIYGWKNLINLDIGINCQYYNYNVLRVLYLLKVRCDYDLEDFYPILLRLSNAKRYFDDYFNIEYNNLQNHNHSC